MEIDEWWPQLGELTRRFLIAHNGEAVPPRILAEIAAVAGSPEPTGWWVGDDDADGVHFSDRAVDWIEETANGESP